MPPATFIVWKAAVQAALSAVPYEAKKLEKSASIPRTYGAFFGTDVELAGDTELTLSARVQQTTAARTKPRIYRRRSIFFPLRQGSIQPSARSSMQCLQSLY